MGEGNPVYFLIFLPQFLLAIAIIVICADVWAIKKQAKKQTEILEKQTNFATAQLLLQMKLCEKAGITTDEINSCIDTAGLEFEEVKEPS